MPVFGTQIQTAGIVVPGADHIAGHRVVIAAADTLAAFEFFGRIFAPVECTFDIEVFDRADRQTDIDVFRLVAVVLAGNGAVGDGHVIVQIAESLPRVEDISHEHDTQIPSVVYQIVLVRIAAGYAVDNVRKVDRLQRCGRNVVILVPQRREELSDADFEFGHDLPGCKSVHYLYVLLSVSVRRAGNSVEGLYLQPEIHLLGDLAVQKQTEPFCLE